MEVFVFLRKLYIWEIQILVIRVENFLRNGIGILWIIQVNDVFWWVFLIEIKMCIFRVYWGLEDYWVSFCFDWLEEVFIVIIWQGVFSILKIKDLKFLEVILKLKLKEVYKEFLYIFGLEILVRFLRYISYFNNDFLVKGVVTFFEFFCDFYVFDVYRLLVSCFVLGFLICFVWLFYD